jgi:hypothetical protein
MNQELPNEIAAKKVGWYFVRFYDSHDELMESLDFRFVEGLKGLMVNQPSPLPSAEGHTEIAVEFLHDVSCNVTPHGEEAKEAKVESNSEGTVVTIPASASCDLTRWLIGQPDRQVEVALLIERVWWTVGLVNELPLEWQDSRPLLSREDFMATSEKALWLRLPARRWIDALLLGFKRENFRRYVLKVTDNTIAIPLRDFSDSREVSDTTEEQLYRLCITKNDQLIEVVVVRIPPHRQPVRLRIARISAPRVASMLTSLLKSTRGRSVQLLIKEARRQYRRPRARIDGQNRAFVKFALCVVAIVVRVSGNQDKSHKINGVWINRARLASQEFPEVMRQVWRRYKELQ